MKFLKSIVTIGIIVYLIALGYLYFFQRKILYLNTHKTVANNGFYLDNKVWVEVRNKNRGKAIIYFGGNAEDGWVNIDKLKSEFNDYAIFFLHYPGFGASKGTPSQDAIFNASLMLYDKIKNEFKDISVIGRSLGTGVAIYLSSKRDVKDLILITPYDSIAHIAKYRYPIFPIDLLIKDRFDSFKYAKDIKVKPTIILSETDKIVPHFSTKELIKNFKENPNVITIKGVNHINIVDSNELYIIEKDVLK